MTSIWTKNHCQKCFHSYFASLLPRKVFLFFRQTNTPPELNYIFYCSRFHLQHNKGKSKTIKYVELGLCTIIKTGSRKLITWLNCLGHSISYHDINLVKTHIAKEQIANVITPAYVPNNIRSEEFITYLYGNSDINVESVYGRSYRCKNANAIAWADCCIWYSD